MIHVERSGHRKSKSVGMGFRRRELHKRQAVETPEKGIFDDEPDWEGGRVRERKGLRWNKQSKSGFDAMVIFPLFSPILVCR